MRTRLPEGFKEIRGRVFGERYPHKELTERIIGCAIKVHRARKAGFLESIYENALTCELRQSGLKAHQQVVYPVYYEGQMVGEHRADMVVEDTVILELKAVSELGPQHVAHVMSTLLAANKTLGLLMNFHEARLVDGLRRVVWEDR